MIHRKSVVLGIFFTNEGCFPNRKSFWCQARFLCWYLSFRIAILVDSVVDFLTHKRPLLRQSLRQEIQILLHAIAGLRR